ncbi:MAG: hypothetical protein WD114_05425 [Phycisphaerales bacterium]
MSARHWSPTTPSTTGWMLGEPNTNGERWGIMGIRASDGRIYQIRHDMLYRGQTGVEREIRPGVMPDWSRIAPAPTPDQAQRYEQVIEQLNGWPFLAWRGEARRDRRGLSPTYSFAFPGSGSAGMNSWDELVLFPYEPVFPGVLINAAIFGGSAYAVVWVIRHYGRRYRRWARHSKGLCQSCGYKIQGLPTCPECCEPIKAEPMDG